MRVTQAETYRNFISDLASLNDTFNTVSRQVSSGKRISRLKDSPGESAELLSMTGQQADIDLYRSSADTVSYYLGVADSALNEVNGLFTSIYTKGSEAATETVDANARAALATDIRSLRDQILSLANSQANGRYIFAGSQVVQSPYEINGDTVTYRGDALVNTVQVDNGTEVQTGASGPEAFTKIFTAIESLLSAVDGNDTAAIGNALGQFASSFSELGQARGKIGAGMTLLQNVQSRLSDQETTLKEQRSKIEDVDAAAAVVQMSQVKTALQAAMSAGGSILQQNNLFDILG
jgi:flagellar hook-associated protein 3 FlgL